MIQWVPTKMHEYNEDKISIQLYYMSTMTICKMYLFYTYFYRKFHTCILLYDIITRHVEIQSPHNWYTRYSIEGIHIVYAKKTFPKRLSKTRNTSKVYILTWSTRREFSSIYIKDENTNDYNPDSIFCWSTQ